MGATHHPPPMQSVEAPPRESTDIEDCDTVRGMRRERRGLRAWEEAIKDDGSHTCILCREVIPKGALVIAATPVGPKAACSETHEAVIWRKTHPQHV